MEEHTGMSCHSGHISSGLPRTFRFALTAYGVTPTSESELRRTHSGSVRVLKCCDGIGCKATTERNVRMRARVRKRMAASFQLRQLPTIPAAVIPAAAGVLVTLLAPG